MKGTATKRGLTDAERRLEKRQFGLEQDPKNYENMIVDLLL